MLSCASLPDYARPQFHIFAEGGTTLQRGFGYRKLTIADFQALSLPIDIRRYSHNLQARSCIAINPDSNFKILVNRVVFSGKVVYVGGFTHISFHAVFKPLCSWWNPQIPAQRRGYVLQHEQIHFALAEITSHKMTRRANKELAGSLAFGQTYEEVQKELIKQVMRLSQETMKADLRLHTAFDDDTSAFFDPKAQKLWLEKVEKELADDKPPVKGL